MDKFLGKRQIDSFLNENEDSISDPEMVIEQDYSNVV